MYFYMYIAVNKLYKITEIIPARHQSTNVCIDWTLTVNC